ncbi:NHL domain-containing protein [Edaphobacter flagellatus]|uniref:NHL domain-containing protein n=1 Tax=Edaphobacter flagellatus TaxID=1933044 RepID=UPI0021B39EFA|nr:SMP-30/gluconolactonase/LRE family protein [Edaphobacter flagellatus]
MTSLRKPLPEGRYAVFAGILFAMVMGSIVLWLNRKQSVEVTLHGGPPTLELSAIAVDDQHNVYVSSRTLNQVFRISADGRIRVVAGDGVRGFSGDGTLATRAALAEPVGLAIARAGDLFVADMGNNRVRQIDPAGTIRTIAGDGTMGGRTNTPAIATGLYEPISIAMDSREDLLIGGTTSIGIRRINAITGIVSKVLGAGLPGVQSVGEPAAGPFWVAASDDGEIYYSDPSRNAVSFLNESTGAVHRIAGSAICGFSGDGGPALDAKLCFPEGLAIGKDRKLYIADTGNNRIRVVDFRRGMIATVAGTGEPVHSGDEGPASKAALRGPMGVALDDEGNLYIADTGNDCIRRIDSATGKIATLVDASDILGVTRGGGSIRR